MERIIRVATVFAITTLIGLVAIIIANGDLTWATAGLVLVIALTLGALMGIWAVVHGQFEQAVEIALTAGIFVAMISAFAIVMASGSNIKSAFVDMFGNGAAWWLVSPVVGTVVITVLFGLHRSTGRR